MEFTLLTITQTEQDLLLEALIHLFDTMMTRQKTLFKYLKIALKNIYLISTEFSE